MALLELDTLGGFGVNRDEKPYRLDPTVWSSLLNVRTQDGVVQTVVGSAQVFDTPAAPAQFLIPLTTQSQTFWLYMSATKGYVWDGSAETEITRAVGGNYNANSYEDWNGVVFGGIPIINNGVDDPQYWASPTVATDLADLLNWPASTTAKVIRALGPYLVALNVTRSGSNFAHMVKWSHPADPGTVPSSWDHTDPTKDTGEYDLPDVNSGVILDGLNLRGQLFIYKEAATWKMRYVGGRLIFAFDTFLETSGLLAPRCAALTSDGQKHFVVTQDDVLVHNGSTAEPVIDKRMRRTLFNSIDSANFKKSFVVVLPNYKEVLFCYPTEGSLHPNMALVWNERTGTITEREVDFVAAAQGPVAIESQDTWTSVVGTWASYVGPWSKVQRREVLVAKQSNGHIHQLEAGTPPLGRIERTGLAIIGKKRDGSPIVDFNRRKLCTRVWPRLSGGPVLIRMGSQDDPEGAVSWQAPQVFDPQTQDFIDVVIEGKALAIEYASQGNVEWGLEGHKLDLMVDGDY